MGRSATTFCFSCGKGIEHPHQVHRDADGNACPGCADRVLEALPALLPAAPGAVVTGDAEVEGTEDPYTRSLYDLPPEPA